MHIQIVHITDINLQANKIDFKLENKYLCAGDSSKKVMI